jgi:CheY-like chemotaxis protein
MEALPVTDEDVMVLTQKGKAELCAPGTPLSAAELELLVLADDRGCVAAVVDGAACLEGEAVRETLRRLLSSGHLESAADRHTSVVDARDFFKGGTGRASRAGNHLALARRAAAHKREAGRKVHVLAAVGAPELVKLLRSYFALEGFVSRVAGSGAQLIGELRQPPVPDVVLLDSALPDVDGLKVLARMRSHPVLKDVPVILLAHDAAHDRLLKALQSDVQGYFSEPFEVEVLLTAVKAVLGLTGSAAPAELGIDWGDRSVPGANRSVPLG